MVVGRKSGLQLFESSERASSMLFLVEIGRIDSEGDHLVVRVMREIEIDNVGRRFGSKYDKLPHPQPAPPTVTGALAITVSYTHLRAHETGRNLVCRLLLEKK